VGNRRQKNACSDRPDGDEHRIVAPTHAMDSTLQTLARKFDPFCHGGKTDPHHWLDGYNTL